MATTSKAILFPTIIHEAMVAAAKAKSMSVTRYAIVKMADLHKIPLTSLPEPKRNVSLVTSSADIAAMILAGNIEGATQALKVNSNIEVQRKVALSRSASKVKSHKLAEKNTPAQNASNLIDLFGERIPFVAQATSEAPVKASKATKAA